MSKAYLVPAASAEVEDVVRRSRFVTRAARATSREDAARFVRETRDRFPGATHYCWAFNAGEPGSTAQVGMSDAGEPHGTAGMPMLTTLLHSGVGEVVVVCARYYSAREVSRAPTRAQPSMSCGSAPRPSGSTGPGSWSLWTTTPPAGSTASSKSWAPSSPAGISTRPCATGSSSRATAPAISPPRSRGLPEDGAAWPTMPSNAAPPRARARGRWPEGRSGCRRCRWAGPREPRRPRRRSARPADPRRA